MRRKLRRSFTAWLFRGFEISHYIEVDTNKLIYKTLCGKEIPLGHVKGMVQNCTCTECKAYSKHR